MDEMDEMDEMDRMDGMDGVKFASRRRWRKTNQLRRKRLTGFRDGRKRMGFSGLAIGGEEAFAWNLVVVAGTQRMEETDESKEVGWVARGRDHGGAGAGRQGCLTLHQGGQTWSKLVKVGQSWSNQMPKNRGCG